MAKKQCRSYTLYIHGENTKKTLFEAPDNGQLPISKSLPSEVIIAWQQCEEHPAGMLIKAIGENNDKCYRGGAGELSHFFLLMVR